MEHPVLEALEVRITPSIDVWTGGAASASNDLSWSNPLNWSQGTPQNGEDLRFPIAGANSFIPTQPIVNDLSGLTLDSIEIDSAGYSMTGNALGLTAPTGIFTTYTSGTSTFGIDANLSGTGITVAAGGELDLNGVISDTSGLLLGGGGIVGGTGQLPSFELQAGELSPGIQGVGNLTGSGHVTLDPGSTFSASLNGPGQNNSLTALGGTSPTVSLDLPTLVVSLAPGFTPAPGAAFYIIVGSVTGNFSGLPEGATLSAGGTTFSISYNQQGVVLTAAKAPSMTQTTVVGGSGQSVFGQSVTFTATVSGDFGTPTGSVTFEDGGSALGVASLDTSGAATFTTADLAPGLHTITAVYGGNATYSGSTSPAYDQTVTPASTTTTVSSGANPSVFGQAVTFTAAVAAVAPSSAIASGGTVTFMDGTATLGTALLSAGVANFTTSALILGQHAISAAYGGDADFTGSTSSAINQVVDQASTSTTLMSSANPVVFGQIVTFTAQVTATFPGTGTPTGTVTFKDGTTTLETTDLSAGVAAFSTSALAVGTHSITAVYTGDANFIASTSFPLDQDVDQASATTLTSAPDPSFLGENVTLTAQVAPVSPGVGTPTGSVAFMDGTAKLGTAPLNSSVATFSTTALALGTHSITAVYSGDADFIASTSSPRQQLVGGTTTALASSVNPSTFGQSVTFTATVAPQAAGGPVPTGAVIFMDGTTVLGNSMLNTAGIAGFSTAGLSGGPHSITAVYQGSAQSVASTSNAINQVVNPESTTTTITSSANPSTFGQSITLTATVSAAVGTPTGSVTFEDGSTVLGAGSLDASGVATFSTSALGAGPHFLVAVYNGSGSFASSPSISLLDTVSQAATTTSLTSSTLTAAVGQNVTFTATVAAVAPGVGVPTGMVSFRDGSTVIGTASVSGGQAVLTVAFSSVGKSHVITAAYVGSANFNASASAGQTENIVQATPAVTLIATPVFMGPKARGVTFQVIVSPATSGAPVPSGAVAFESNGRTFSSHVLAGGSASVFISKRRALRKTFSVRYRGDADYKARVSNRIHIGSSFFRSD